jgi:hypothetical protein
VQGPTTLGLVTYSPVGLPFQFAAQRCSVTVDHVEIRCETGPGVGARLLWTVTVDDLSSSYPLTSYRAPVISSLGRWLTWERRHHRPCQSILFRFADGQVSEFLWNLGRGRAAKWDGCV